MEFEPTNVETFRPGDPEPLPPGDIHFDGFTLSIDGRVLEPGRYAVGSGVLEVYETPAEDGPDDVD